MSSDESFDSDEDHYEDSFIDDGSDAEELFDDNDSNHSVEIIENSGDYETDIYEYNATQLMIDAMETNNGEESVGQDSDINDSDIQNIADMHDIVEEVVESVPQIETNTNSAVNKGFVYSQSTQNTDNCCIICTEVWTTSGDHQLVSLNCGHLFGKSCINKWFKSVKRGAERCPQCNKKSKIKDIRVLYARNLVAVDTTEKDNALEKYEREKEMRLKLENQTMENSIQLKQLLKENERLKRENMECKLKIQELSSSSKNTEKVIADRTIKVNNRKTELFEFIRDLEISNSGECRLIGYSGLYESLVVSQPNSNLTLFPGFGVKKVSLNDLSKTDCICIHTKSIKDLEINAYDGTILTTSLDKTIKLTSLLSKSNILSYDLEIEAWSVAFNPKNKHEFYAGLRNGQILLYDMRMTSTHVDSFHPFSSSPVVSLNNVDYHSNFGPVNGILSTQFNSFNLHQRHNDSSDRISSNDFSTYKIPFEGRFSSSHFEPKSGLTLLSCRPSTKHKKVTHYVMDLSMKTNESNEHIIHPNVCEVFEGGTEQVQLSRSRIFANPTNESSVLVCAGDESSKGALIWDISSGSCIQKLRSDLPVLDMSLLHNINTNVYFMTALTGKSLKIYRCNQ